jgi:two-component system chemotaxis sensor kinase CheA
MTDLDDIKATFFQECDELLADLESGLLAMEGGDTDPETVNAVFRAVHSVKGGAGAFGLEPLVRYAHVFETLLDEVRSARVIPSPELLRTLLRAADVLQDHMVAARTGGGADEAATAAMVAVLEGFLPGHGAGPDAPEGAEDSDPFDFKPMLAGDFDFDAPAADSPGEPGWRIVFRPAASLYAHANEVATLLRELGQLGAMEVHLVDDALPVLSDLEPEESYLSWTISLKGDVTEAQVREVFDFVDGDCELLVEAEQAQAADLPLDIDIAAMIAAAQRPLEPLAALDAGPQADFSPPAPVPAPVAASSVAAAQPAAPARAAAHEPAHAQASTIRVDPERIDTLIDLVGELVINQAMLAQRVAQHGFAPSSDVVMGLDELEQLTRGIQDSVMAIRAQPVKSVFQRMPRLVREVASQTGKQARLTTEGEGTEVDKTVIERLAEPITHMLRNAIDHGLETPQERLAAGKPAEGSVRLAALHRGGRIVIEVADDGRGINRQKVRQIAIDRGLIAPEAMLTDEEVDNLIFLPGFSTAASISDISGRGVGMDVVRRSIQALGGRISISSRPGEGSTFTLSLPLTLAVLDGMVVDVAGHTLVVPLTAIVESLKPRPQDISPLGPQGSVLAVRQTYVPIVDIGCVLGYRSAPLNPAEAVILLVEQEGGARAALAADAIQGQRQVVIKSLEANYRQVEGIAAATILGDGRVALILDVDGLIAMRRREPMASLDLNPIAAE